MIERRRFLAAGAVAMAPVVRPTLRLLPVPERAAPLLASNALALLIG